LLILACACSGDPERAAPARVVIMTDTHVIGPQYTMPVENSPTDNASIVHTVERLERVRDQLNAMTPRPDAVIVMGDVVHAAHHSQDVDWYDTNATAFSVAQDLYATFDMPVHVLMGNHDYETGCGGEDYPKALSEELFRRHLGAEPYYAVEYGGVKFNLLNGQQGYTWDPTDARCDDDFASFGPAQLAWLDDTLADDKPAVVMSHYMGLLWQRDENPMGGQQADLFHVLDAHPNVKLVLAGHLHRWTDLSFIFGNYEHYVMGGTRYDGDNFWVLDLDGTGAITIADKDKAIWTNSCARTFRYDGATPVADDGAIEDGDCVTGQD
jgi:3',5'-cyclic AMP phosphodiesterase CpdA